MMFRLERVWPFLFFVALLLPAGAAAAPLQQDGEDGSPLSYRDGRMAALVEELSLESPTVARMLARLDRAGIPVVFGTPETLLADVRKEHRDYDPTRARALGFMAPRVRALRGGGMTTEGVFVVLDLRRLDQLFHQARELPRPAGMSWRKIQRLETLALLGHEIIHAYALVMAGGDPRGGCHDPREGQSAGSACVVVAENLIRREMNAPMDWGYGLAPLSQLPDLYQRHGEHREDLQEVTRHASRVLRDRTPVWSWPSPLPAAPARDAGVALLPEPAGPRASPEE